MKNSKKFLSLFLSLLIFLTSVFPVYAKEEVSAENFDNAIYIGVLGINTINAKYKNDFLYKFNIGGVEKSFKVSPKNNYQLNNLLIEGEIYNLKVVENTIDSIGKSKANIEGALEKMTKDTLTINGSKIKYDDNSIFYQIETEAGGAKLKNKSLKIGDYLKVYGDKNQLIVSKFEMTPYQAPVSGEAGKRTLKNFLATAMEPVGTTLYIYGGGWDWQDEGSSNQARKIGLSSETIEFYQKNDANYTYKSKDISNTYYPFSGFNQYYYAGLDCSGYVGWVTYNVMNKVDGASGFVQSSTKMAKSFAEKHGFGMRTTNFTVKDFKPGDIFSMSGHVWICVGTCDDGSMVILHSTPSNSRFNKPGGGVQISAIGPDQNCEAYKLADEYMSKYFKDWYSRYGIKLVPYEEYTFVKNENAGKFSWNIADSGLNDPDNYVNMKAKDVLKDLFKNVK